MRFPLPSYVWWRLDQHPTVRHRRPGLAILPFLSTWKPGNALDRGYPFAFDGLSQQEAGPPDKDFDFRTGSLILLLQPAG